jgi:endonuclease/exonuclease/phosphatase family metal-dependent hydrolase
VSRSLTVVTWNLWWRFGPWRERADAIRSVLVELRPDICGLQEVWADDERNFASELAAQLQMHWVWTRSPEPERWHRRLPGCSAEVGNAILAGWPIHEPAELALPPGSSGDRSRNALVCVVDSPAGRDAARDDSAHGSAVGLGGKV